MKGRRIRGAMLGALVVATAGLGMACGDGGRSTGSGGHVAVAPSARDIPGCGEIAGVLGPLVAPLLPGAEHEERFDNERMFGVSCSWVTPEAASDDPFEQIKLGALVVAIDVDRMREPGELAVLRSMGMIHEDARADAIGAFVTALGSPLDPGAPVGVAGLQVTRGQLSVSVNGTGVLMTQADGLRHVTNDAAIEAAVALLRRME